MNTATTPTQPVRDTLPNILRGEDGAVARATNADFATIQVEFFHNADRRFDFFLWFEPGHVFTEDDVHVVFVYNREDMADALFDQYHVDVDAAIWQRVQGGQA